MTINLANADEYRELRIYVKPDNLHGAIDELFMLDAFDVKITPLLEMDGPGPDDKGSLTEYMLEATFGGTERLDADS